MTITVLQSVSYYQVANVFAVWVQDHVDLRVGSASIPVPWFQSIDPLASIAAVPLLFVLWKWQARRREPDDLAKISIGAALAGASNLVLVGAIALTGGARVHWIWPVVYCAGLGIGFIYYWPTLLALVSRTAPASVNATMMGLAFLSLFVANNLIGWLGRYYEPLGPQAFWLLHAAIGFGGTLLVLILGRSLRRALGVGPASSEPGIDDLTRPKGREPPPPPELAV
jgi:proton-dependent oligopeptide transporter, POT family